MYDLSGREQGVTLLAQRASERKALELSSNYTGVLPSTVAADCAPAYLVLPRADEWWLILCSSAWVRPQWCALHTVLFSMPLAIGGGAAASGACRRRNEDPIWPPIDAQGTNIPTSAHWAVLRTIPNWFGKSRLCAVHDCISCDSSARFTLLLSMRLSCSTFAKDSLPFEQV